MAALEELLAVSDSVTSIPRTNLSIEDVKNMFCEVHCEDTALYIFLRGFGFIVLFLIAIAGNFLNIMIYNSAHIRAYPAIRMLCTRLLMNSLTMLCLLPSALRLLGAWPPGGTVDQVYLKWLPFETFFGNVFGFTSTWLTVLMTAECFSYLFHPGRTLGFFTKKTLYIYVTLLLLAGSLLSMIYPLNRSATFHLDYCGIKIELHSSTDSLATLEQVHTVSNLIFALVLPLSLLLFMTVRIVRKMNETTESDVDVAELSSDEHSLSRITLITTTLQFLELPTVFTFAYAAVRKTDHSYVFCALHTISLFLALCNMSLSFFVYTAFSPKFYNLAINRWRQISSKFLPARHTSEYTNYNTDYGTTTEGAQAGRELIPLTEFDDEA